MSFVLIALGGYLLGSFPSGYVLGRMRGVDIRTKGSGNIGATNTLRVLGKKWGYLCFALDIGKGVAAVLLARFLAVPALGVDPTYAAIVAGVCVLLGHNFPVWLGFKGGKGVATSGGVAIVLFPPLVFVLSIAAWIALFFTTRIVSVASIGAAITLAVSSTALWLIGWMPPPLALIALGMAVLAIWLHRSNIARLARGEEPRFEKRAKS